MMSTIRRPKRHADPKVDRLRACELFASFPDSELAEIAATTDELTVEAGRTLTEQGDPGSEAFLILEGTCRVEVDGAPVATLGAGDMVGEMALLEVSDRSATVVTETACRLLVLDRRTFWQFVERRGVRTQVMRQLAERLRRADQRAATT